jgi:hypothetical protein
MPMAAPNTMAARTRENPNARVDRMAPASPQAGCRLPAQVRGDRLQVTEFADWVGLGYCDPLRAK